MLVSLSPTTKRASGSITIPERFRTRDDLLMAKAIEAAGATVVMLGEQGIGAKQPGYPVSGATDNLSCVLEDGIRARFLSGGASVSALNATVNRDKFVFDRTIESVISCSNVEYGTDDEDHTWIFVFEVNAAQTNYIAGQSIVGEEAGARFGLLVNTNGAVIVNNKVSNNPAGSQNSVQFSGADAIPQDIIVMVWESWDASTNQISIGRGVDDTPLATGDWSTNGLARPGSGGIQLGNAGSNNSNTMTGGIYAAIKVRKHITDFDAPRLLSALAKRFQVA